MDRQWMPASGDPAGGANDAAATSQNVPNKMITSAFAAQDRIAAAGDRYVEAIGAHAAALPMPPSPT
eukprot:2201789-Pyramimonas_sp.AAC.1